MRPGDIASALTNSVISNEGKERPETFPQSGGEEGNFERGRSPIQNWTRLVQKLVEYERYRYDQVQEVMMSEQEDGIAYYD